MRLRFALPLLLLLLSSVFAVGQTTTLIPTSVGKTNFNPFYIFSLKFADGTVISSLEASGSTYKVACWGQQPPYDGYVYINSTCIPMTSATSYSGVAV